MTRSPDSPARKPSGPSSPDVSHHAVRPTVVVVAELGVDGVTVARQARSVFDHGVDWSVLAVLPPHPAATTGATGFAGPMLTSDQFDDLARQEDHDGAVLVRSIARTLDPQDETSVDCAMIRSDPSVHLVDGLTEQRVDAVVAVAPADRTWRSSSLADQLVEHAPCPVTLVPDTLPDDDDPALDSGAERLLVAVDGSPLDEKVIHRSLELLDRRGDRDGAAAADGHHGLEVVIAHVDPSRQIVRSMPLATGLGVVAGGEHLADATRRLADAADRAEDVAEQIADDAGLVDATPIGEVGDVATALQELIDRHDVDVLALGTHQRSWWSRLFRPSVTATVTEHVPCPVLIVRPEDTTSLDHPEGNHLEGNHHG